MARSAQLAVPMPRRLTGQFWLRSLGWEVALVAVVLCALTGTTRGYVLAAAIAMGALVFGVPIKGRSLIGWATTLAGFLRRRSDRVEEPADLPVDLVPIAQWVPGLTVNQTRSALLSAGSVRLRRSGGGFGEFLTGITVASVARMPSRSGKSEAM